MTIYHHAVLKPLRPDRGLPNPFKALLSKLWGRPCQEHEDHHPKMLGKAASPFTPTHSGPSVAAQKPWSKHTCFEVLLQPHQQQDGKVDPTYGAPRVAGRSG